MPSTSSSDSIFSSEPISSTLTTPPTSPSSPLYSPTSEYITAESSSSSNEYKLLSEDNLAQDISLEDMQRLRIINQFQAYIYLKGQYSGHYQFDNQTFQLANCQTQMRDHCIHLIQPIEFHLNEVQIPDILNLHLITFLAGILDSHCIDVEVLQTLHKIGIPFCDQDFQIWKHLLLEFHLEEAINWEHLITQLHDLPHPSLERLTLQDHGHIMKKPHQTFFTPSLYFG